MEDPMVKEAYLFAKPCPNRGNKPILVMRIDQGCTSKNSKEKAKEICDRVKEDMGDIVKISSVYLFDTLPLRSDGSTDVQIIKNAIFSETQITGRNEDQK